MKIITPTKVYVQRNDILYLRRSVDNPIIPACVFKRCFIEPFICVDSNRHEFMEWDEPEAIEFFKNWSYCVDFLGLQEFTDEELINQSAKMSEERNRIVERYHSMPWQERAENEHLMDECYLLEFKMYSLRDVLLFRQGQLKFKLPAEISDKEKRHNSNKGIKRFFKKFKQSN